MIFTQQILKWEGEKSPNEILPRKDLGGGFRG